MTTVEQRRLVRQSFDSLREQAEPVALLFYGRLFELDPSARRLFHIDLAVQARKIVETLATVTESLDRFESMRPRLAELGRQHAGYGVRHVIHAWGGWRLEHDFNARATLSVSVKIYSSQ